MWSNITKCVILVILVITSSVSHPWSFCELRYSDKLVIVYHND